MTKIGKLQHLGSLMALSCDTLLSFSLWVRIIKLISSEYIESQVWNTFSSDLSKSVVVSASYLGLLVVLFTALWFLVAFCRFILSISRMTLFSWKSLWIPYIVTAVFKAISLISMAIFIYYSANELTLIYDKLSYGPTSALPSFTQMLGYVNELIRIIAALVVFSLVQIMTAIYYIGYNRGEKSKIE